MVANLIENALKYSPAGTTIRISLAGSNPTAVWSVSDNGPGIPAEYQSRVFDLFNHIPAMKNQKAVSSGVGLAFCKLAVEAHAGTITLESEPGKGSTFCIRLPLA
ncbi:MAG: Sensor histidine kinase TmoS [bacterium ADurb.Bin374]|nr:MAG: Sensor histidine kinase TmoS [bacterium ADurb.Bin374]